MEIRESLNKNKKLGIGIGAGILVLAVALIAYQLRGSGGPVGTVADTAFYTDDNGKTFFKDDLFKVSPFDHNGKQAYRADVFQCPDGKQFVGVMYRHNAFGRKTIEDRIAKGMTEADTNLLTVLDIQGTEFKRPGAPDNAWRSGADPESIRASVRCPGTGSTADLVMP